MGNRLITFLLEAVGQLCVFFKSILILGLNWISSHCSGHAMLLLLLSCVSRVWLCATPQTAAHQAPPSLGFSSQEHWSGLPFPSPMHESEKWKWSRSVVSDSLRPYGLQPTRLLRPWIFQARVLEWGAIAFGPWEGAKQWNSIWSFSLHVASITWFHSIPLPKESRMAQPCMGQRCILCTEEAFQDKFKG